MSGSSCPYCQAPVGADGSCARCGGLETSTPSTGWRPDPTARHEGRYYVTGRPTNRVRNGRSEATDPAGGRMLPGYVELPGTRSGIRLTWLATGATTVVVVMAAAVGWVLWADRHKPAPSPEAGYLTALENGGLSKEFNSEANAVAHGHDVCRRLEDGGPQQGPPADKIAVDAFCPHFNKGFRILEAATVSGIFVLTDSAGMGVIAVDGPSCEGADGYADVGPTTPVTVKNGRGELLTTTALGVGKGDSATCTFSFTFPITEGQDRYVVAVGHRGEFAYGFEQLCSHGVQIRLGH